MQFKSHERPKVIFGGAVSLHRLDHQTVIGQAVPEVFIP
jgi:hypothetical protein